MVQLFQLTGTWSVWRTFDGDNKPDYALYNAVTHQTGVWYLNNTVFVGGAFGPTLPANWNVVGVADFDRGRQARLCAQQCCYTPNRGLVSK